MAAQTFHCEHGHIWVGTDSKCPLHGTVALEVPRTAKTKPKRAKQESKPAAKVQQLHCELGEHNWSRPAQRGKPPKNCPEHQPAKPAPSAHKPRSTEPSAPTRPQIPALAELQRMYPNMDDESARIFAYVENEISSPTWPRGREPADITLLLGTYNSRRRFVARGSMPVSVAN